MYEVVIDNNWVFILLVEGFWSRFGFYFKDDDMCLINGLLICLL